MTDYEALAALSAAVQNLESVIAEATAAANAKDKPRFERLMAQYRRQRARVEALRQAMRAEAA